MPVKLVVCGGYGAGKTTFVGAISEIVPITTEAPLTEVSLGTDEGAVATKLATTVALDFGRISLDSGLVLYLFGTPGQSRFRFAWDEVTRGAIGAVILVDSRRIDDAFPSVDFCEARGIPFVVAVNRFDGALAHDLDDDPRGARARRRGPGARHRRPLAGRRQGHAHRARAPRIARRPRSRRPGWRACCPSSSSTGTAPSAAWAPCARFLDQDVPGGVRVVVVDNGSEPEARGRSCARGCPPASPLLELPRNRGFGPGANVGLPPRARPPRARRRRLDRAGPARRRAGRPAAWPGCSRWWGSGPAPGWPAPTSATAPRRSSTRTSAGSSPRPRSPTGWEPAGHPHGTLLLARRQVLEEVGPVRRALLRLLRGGRPGPAGRRPPAGRPGLIRGAIVVNPDLGTRVSVIDYLQLRNTLLLVREHSGRYHATIRFLLAVGQLLGGPGVAGAAGPVLGPAGPGAGARRPRPRPLRRRRRSSIQDR